jgi:4-hydroxybenzoate polyprenyltransferase
LASGRLSPQAALAASLLLLVVGLTLGYLSGAIWLTLVYLVASTTYTFWVKRKVLADVFLLAGLYMVRILIGGQAAGYHASSWLLAFSCFFFLSLALVKRVNEVQTLAARAGGDVARRGYRSTDGATLKMFGVASGFVASLVLALYLQSAEVVARYREPILLWALPALVVYWECRIWLRTDRGEVHDDPLVFAARDRTSWLVAALAAAAFAAAVLAPAASIPWE